MNESVHAASFTRTLRLKVRAESFLWLNAAAVEVNQVFNWANATSIDAADRNRRANAKFLSGFDLCNLSAGATEFFERIGADTIQRICCEFAQKRKAAQRLKLRWRVSRGSRRSLGWVPFAAARAIKMDGDAVIHLKRRYRLWLSRPVDPAAITGPRGSSAPLALGPPRRRPTPPGC